MFFFIPTFGSYRAQTPNSQVQKQPELAAKRNIPAKEPM
jgi:hypothetical protein